ncbi:sensor domain-containing diguanylate cyclase [Methylomonas rhizoryzae]|uniref:sensor domain-containing diguanylate cyclase n=1 Tax=Methylomonas rhizoryzae TaxID=2608981 RepID=UPI0012328CB1|nr:sensor domain-containing diguanylate cyclase [Methylomonas rhizoryzae]
MVKTSTNRNADTASFSVATFLTPSVFRNYPQLSLHAESLQALRVRLLYANLPVSIGVSGMLAFILVTVQATVIDPERLTAWSLALTLVLSARAVLFAAWRRSANESSHAAMRRWLLLFRIGAVLAGTVWGIGGVVLAPPGNTGHIFYVSFVLIGLCAGAASSLAVDRLTINGFLIAVLLPHTFFLANLGGSASLGMSVMSSLFLFFLAASARHSALQLEENFRLQHIATENETKLRQMLENSPIATCIADAADNRILFVNQSYLALIEASPEQIVGVSPVDYYAKPEDYTAVSEHIRAGTQISNKLLELRSLDGQSWTKWTLASYSPIEYQHKAAILAWFYDITERKLKEDHVEHMAYHDALTGLPNRSLILDRLQQAQTEAELTGNMVALMFIDLDKFKPVNDLHGHNIGDLLLKFVAERIRGCLRKTDSAARIGGDEFVVLLPALPAVKNAVDVAEKLRQALNLPFEINGLILNISSSIGLAVYPEHAEDTQSLIKHADIAMYYAKAEGRNCVRVFRPQMQDRGMSSP